MESYCRCIASSKKPIYMPTSSDFSFLQTLSAVEPNFCGNCNKPLLNFYQQKSDMEPLDTTEFGLCPNCNSDTFVRSENNELVCDSCCYVSSEINFGSKVIYKSESDKKPYKRRFYQNELQKQFEMDDPRLDPIILHLFLDAHRKRNTAQESYNSETPPKKKKRNEQHIREETRVAKYIRIPCRNICTKKSKKKKNIPDNEWVELKAEHLPFVNKDDNPGRKRENLSKFGENWKQINHYLYNQTHEDAGSFSNVSRFKMSFYKDFFIFYHNWFKTIEYYFEFIRHSPTCPRKENSKAICRQHKCRLSMLNKNFLYNRLSKLFFSPERPALELEISFGIKTIDEKAKKQLEKKRKKFLEISDSQWRSNCNKLYRKFWEPLVKYSQIKQLQLTLHNGEEVS